MQINQIKKNKISEFFKPKALSSKLKASSGFTLIETLVAITILLLSITGPLQIASNALLSSYYSRDQITAFYLAAEAIEYIKNGRDTTFLTDVFNPSNPANNFWLKGFENCISGGDPDFIGCTIDALEPFSTSVNAVVSCLDNGIVCPPLKFDPATGLWGYTSTMPNSKFTRTVEIIPQPGNWEAVIKVKIEWQGLSFFGSTKSFELSGLITNWQRI